MVSVWGSGGEFGTVTGRKRRCGWFDAVMVRQAGLTAGITGMALTKLDVLDGFDRLKICVGYDCCGERLITSRQIPLTKRPVHRSMKKCLAGRKALMVRAHGPICRPMR